MSAITFEGLTAARSRLQVLVNGLRDAAGGGVVDRAAAKVGEQVAAVSRRVLGQHVHTGTARGSADIVVAGGRIDLNAIGYLRHHPWWPFRRGMPPFVVTRAIKIFAAELVAALAGERSPLALADEAAEELAEAKRQAVVAKERKREEAARAAYDKRVGRLAAARGRHEARLARLHTRSAARSAKHEASMAKFRARQAKRDARSEARLSRSREKYKRDNARIWRRSAEGRAARVAARRAARAR